MVGNTRQQFVPGGVFVPFQDFPGNGVQWNPDRDRPALFRFPGDVFDRPVDDGPFREVSQVRNTATDDALEHKDVPLDRQPGIVGKIVIEQLVPFLNGDVIRCPVHFLRDCEFLERGGGRQFIGNGPKIKRPQMFQKLIDGVLPPLNRQPGFRDRLECFFELAVEEYHLPVPLIIGGHLEIGVFVPQVFHEFPQCVIGHLVNIQVGAVTLEYEEPFERPPRNTAVFHRGPG